MRLVGTDMSERSVGRHLCDAFHIVPAGSDPAFPDAMLAVAEREGVDAILPQSSFDLEGLAAHVDRFPMPVLVSSPDAIERSNDKAETYAFLHRIGVTAPEFRRVNGAREVAAAAEELGYPDRPVCFKPVFSSGSRGFRDPRPDGRSRASAAERAARVGGDAARGGGRAAAGRGRARPARDGARRSAASGRSTGSANGREIVLGHPKTREAMRAGLAMYFVTLEDEELMRTGNLIVAELGIEHFFNIQLVGEHVIEINPRISTIVYQEDLNLPYSA